MKVQTKGFTLVEIMVVIAIIAILSSIIYANFSQGSAQSRDAKRKADLRLVQNALELYRQDNGRYPAGCNGAWVWSGEIGTNYDCSVATDSQYIVGLAPKYIPVLPTDPKSGSGNYGYVYLTNPNGTVYKFVSRNSVETETLNDLRADFDFKACDIVGDSNGDLAQTVASGNCTSWSEYIASKIPIEGGRCTLGICNRYSNGVGGFNQPAPDCALANIGLTKTSYAVWGGYAEAAGGVGGSEDLKIEYNTERVLCVMP